VFQSPIFNQFALALCLHFKSSLSNNLLSSFYSEIASYPAYTSLLPWAIYNWCFSRDMVFCWEPLSFCFHTTIPLRQLLNFWSTWLYKSPPSVGWFHSQIIALLYPCSRAHCALYLNRQGFELLLCLPFNHTFNTA
jgi:hypothetical protein